MISIAMKMTAKWYLHDIAFNYAWETVISHYDSEADVMVYVPNTESVDDYYNTQISKAEREGMTFSAKQKIAIYDVLVQSKPVLSDERREIVAKLVAEVEFLFEGDFSIEDVVR